MPLFSKDILKAISCSFTLATFSTAQTHILFPWAQQLVLTWKILCYDMSWEVHSPFPVCMNIGSLFIYSSPCGIPGLVRNWCSVVLITDDNTLRYCRIMYLIDPVLYLLQNLCLWWFSVVSFIDLNALTIKILLFKTSAMTLFKFVLFQNLDWVIKGTQIVRTCYYRETSYWVGKAFSTSRAYGFALPEVYTIYMQRVVFFNRYATGQ